VTHLDAIRLRPADVPLILAALGVLVSIVHDFWL
jgi:hypothetical protein